MQMTGHPQIQYRPPQPVPGQYPTPFSQQQQQPYGMSPQYQVAPPQQQFVIMRAPAGPMPQQQFQQQARQPEQPKFQPRKKNIIQIKDPTDNRDITDEIMSSSKQSSGSFSGSTSTTPSVTPEVSGQSSNASTPPMNPPQMPEDVRAKFAAQVAATLEDGVAPSKPQEAPDVPQTETPVKKEESVQKEILRKPEKVEATTTESAQKVLESVENPKLEPSPPPVESAKEVLPTPELVKPVAQRETKEESVAQPTQVEKAVDVVKPVEKEVTKSEPVVVEAIKAEEVVETVSAGVTVEQESMPGNAETPVSSEPAAVILNGSDTLEKSEEKKVEASVDSEKINEPAASVAEAPVTAASSTETAEVQQVENKAEVVEVAEPSTDANKDAPTSVEEKVNGHEAVPVAKMDTSPPSLKNGPDGAGKLGSDFVVQEGECKNSLFVGLKL